NDALHPCITGGDQNVQRARDVEFIGRQRIIDAAGHRWQRRLMKYVVHALKDRLERLTIGDADLVYFEVAVQMRDILAFACAKVVDDADAMTVFQQTFCDVGADEACASSDDVGFCHSLKHPCSVRVFPGRWCCECVVPVGSVWRVLPAAAWTDTESR